MFLLEIDIVKLWSVKELTVSANAHYTNTNIAPTTVLLGQQKHNKLSCYYLSIGFPEALHSPFSTVFTATMQFMSLSFITMIQSFNHSSKVHEMCALNLYFVKEKIQNFFINCKSGRGPFCHAHLRLDSKVFISLVHKWHRDLLEAKTNNIFDKYFIFTLSWYCQKSKAQCLSSISRKVLGSFCQKLQIHPFILILYEYCSEKYDLYFKWRVYVFYDIWLGDEVSYDMYFWKNGKICFPKKNILDRVF